MANTRITQGVIKPNEDYDVRHINATGIITAQNISIGGTLTYNDVTNVDSIGVITARSGIFIGAGQSIGPVSGIITYYGDGSKLSGIDATQLKGPAGNVVIQGYDTGAVHTGFSTMQNLRVTGIATFGTSSTVINGDQNIIHVGTALTLGHTQGLQFHTQNLHSAGFEINQINASGIITASEFRGSGAGLSGMPVAIGTALGAAGSGLDAFFYVNKVLPVTSTVTVDPPSSSDRAYTHYTDIQVSDSADLIIAEGDDLIPDVLGLANNGTFGGGSSAGRLRVNLITDKDATGAPTVSNGLIISGVTTTSDIKVGTGATLNVYGGATFSGIVTASSFSGDGSNLTGIQVGGGTSLSFNDNVAVYFGNSNDMSLYHVGYNSNIKNITGYLRLLTDNFSVMNEAANQIIIKGNNDDGTGQQGVQLYYGGNQKFTTTNTGAVVSGILTATSFSGDGSALTGTGVGRNMLINGEMVANQRSNGGQNVNSSTSKYPVDRWHSRGEGGKNFTVAQIAGASQGLGVRHYMRAEVTAHGSVGSNDIFNFRQNIEGYNVQRINLGESTCNSMSLSFTVRSSLAGTHSGAIQNSAQNLSYPFTYTLAQNAWTDVKITIPPITSGSFNETNGVGLRVVFDLGSGDNFRGTANQWNSGQDEGATGAVRLIENAGATWDITKVQLEEGTVCTSFEKKLYADVIRDCMRYYQVANSSIISPILNNSARIPIPILPVEMRGTPTPGTSNGYFVEFSAGTVRTITGFYSLSSKGGGYAQLNGSPANGVYFNAYFDAEI